MLLYPQLAILRLLCIEILAIQFLLYFNETLTLILLMWRIG